MCYHIAKSEKQMHIYTLLINRYIYIASLEFLFYNVNVVNFKIEMKIKTVFWYLVWLLRNIIDINILRLYIRFFNA